LLSSKLLRVTAKPLVGLVTWLESSLKSDLGMQMTFDKAVQLVNTLEMHMIVLKRGSATFEDSAMKVASLQAAAKVITSE